MSRPATFEHRFLLSTDVETAFSLFSDPRHLDALTPSWFRLTPLEDLPAHLDAGLEIAYRLRWRGLRLRWTSRLTDWRFPTFFAYEQARGPYRFFRHEHSFAAGPDGTRVLDRVIFAAPGGRLVERLVVRPDLVKIFSFREVQALSLLRTVRDEQASRARP